MASNIGIKIANGDFYPLVEENSLVKKKLVLTTVHDNQPSVQIDLYRNSVNEMTDAQYIGSLVVENIKLKPKGEPSIEMVISSNSKGEIIADAIDLDAKDGEHYVLTVSLKSLDETARDMEIPDFDLESDEKPAGLYNQAVKARKEKSSKSLLWLLILLLLILGLAAWLFFFNGLAAVKSYLGSFSKPAGANSSEYLAEPAKPEPPAPEPAPPPPAPEPAPSAPEPVPVITAPAAPPAPQPAAASRRDRPLPPVASYNVPDTIPREGVNYTIRWGDTLWDIADAFYRNPRLYPRIAQFNNIRNPNHIISGRTIKIPPRN